MSKAVAETADPRAVSVSRAVQWVLMLGDLGCHLGLSSVLLPAKQLCEVVHLYGFNCTGQHHELLVWHWLVRRREEDRIPTDALTALFKS
jgi:hypothetical protein